jgi:hypothetical protein
MFRPIANPLNEVLQAFASVAKVEDFLDQKFFKAIIGDNGSWLCMFAVVK